MKRIVILMAAVLVVFAGAVPAIAHGNDSRQRVDVLGQGGSEPVLAHNGAVLNRNDDGLRLKVKVRTPRPGSYEYPTADMVPPGGSHPEVIPGGPGEPEVFTLWAFVFNYPAECTDPCDFDDIGDTPAKGGVYQIDGRIADQRKLVLEGSIRLGQAPAAGSPLENPDGAEVHAAIAPHGMAHTGEDLWAQLNGSVGNPSLWWPALFLL